MNVYIFGGEKQQYLSTQLEYIRANIFGCNEIIYVSGPVSASRMTSSSRSHVAPSQPIAVLNLDTRPRLKHFRIRDSINHICANYLGNEYAMFLHGDMIPIATLDCDMVLDSNLSAKVRGHSVQFCLTREGIGHEMLETRNVKIWGMGPLAIGSHECQLVSPGFVHLDNYSTDSDDVVLEKLEAFKAAYPL
jgi:hypothetical protein